MMEVLGNSIRSLDSLERQQIFRDVVVKRHYIEFDGESSRRC